MSVPRPVQSGLEPRSSIIHLINWTISRVMSLFEVCLYGGIREVAHDMG